MNKRDFLKTSALAIAGATVGVNAFSKSNNVETFRRIRFGICADVHQDIIHDAPERLNAFIEEMNEQHPDFIIQLGDFCSPYDRNRNVMEIWNRFSGSRFHVIGNHDTDGGFNRDQVVDFWKSNGKYYSFDLKGYHFVVLDTNENEHNKSRNSLAKYGSFVSDRQLAWLESDLTQTSFPAIIFCHHGLDNDFTGVENATKVRFILESVNNNAKFKKVQVVFSGHHHQDYVNVINGIYYIQINSMSYKWLGTKYSHVPYSQEINEKYPLLQHTVPYKDPLWALVDISKKSLKLTGKQTQFVGKTPQEMGVTKYENIYPVVPTISDRHLRLM